MWNVRVQVPWGAYIFWGILSVKALSRGSRLKLFLHGFTLVLKNLPPAHPFALSSLSSCSLDPIIKAPPWSKSLVQPSDMKPSRASQVFPAITGPAPFCEPCLHFCTHPTSVDASACLLPQLSTECQSVPGTVLGTRAIAVRDAKVPARVVLALGWRIGWSSSHRLWLLFGTI